MFSVLRIYFRLIKWSNSDKLASQLLVFSHLPTQMCRTLGRQIKTWWLNQAKESAVPRELTWLVGRWILHALNRKNRWEINQFKLEARRLWRQKIVFPQTAWVLTSSSLTTSHSLLQVSPHQAQINWPSQVWQTWEALGEITQEALQSPKWKTTKSHNRVELHVSEPIPWREGCSLMAEIPSRLTVIKSNSLLTADCKDQGQCNTFMRN